MAPATGRRLRGVLTSADKLEGAKVLYRSMLGDSLREAIDVAETLGDGDASEALHDALDRLEPLTNAGNDGTA